ncbi:hypothetical protein [Acidicapsa acidisoli]|uniref:hypothetical protein n=1 Tax=Acidicapsa acidisoli TaxID=1615681 RepID=UPI0021E0630C|nr:hypothetical protein [Acidicapsa acidisoli]
MSSPSHALDAFTNTFTSDRKLFDSLMEQTCREDFVEMCVWYIWLQEYLHDIQNSLHDGGKSYGPNYQAWVVSMIGGAAQSIGMLMYLLTRGVVHEAAASGRRALEHLAMASHLVRDPAKGRFLNRDEVESLEFKKAFIIGADPRESKRLKDNGIKYRFAAMSGNIGKSSTQLYEIFSRFNIHGGTLSSLSGLALTPTAHSCAFHNRSVDEIAKNLPLFKPILEFTATELVDLVGNHGVRSERINQAGACVLVWLNRNDPRWLERLHVMRQSLGLGNLRPRVRPN